MSEMEKAISRKEGISVIRPRRLRKNEAIRGLCRETRLHREDLIYPLFVTEGQGGEIPSMPGIRHFTLAELAEEGKELVRLGIPAVLLFGVPKNKDEVGSSAYCPGNIIEKAVKTLKAACPELYVICDVCLCEYMSHGHCGVVANGDVDNDATLPLLAKAAVSYAAAGADMVAPSDMMDGRVAAIRAALDAAGQEGCAILSYSAKYASAFYGPFRDAAGSAPQFGDRRTYQMDCANRREALREVEQDIAEGMDAVIVKPALAYLDILSDVKRRFDLPICAYNVSGEYSMICAAGEKGWLDRDRAAVESLLCIKRAGADMIITYFAKDLCQKNLI